jgi:hypothetical protein
MKREDAQIYILTHRKSLIKENSLYTALQIGAEYTKQDIYPLKDNMMPDNISLANPYYCDVCGTYYVYKNLLKTKYIGLCGCRRYLDIKENENFEKILDNYDIILPPKEHVDSLISNYKHHHNFADIYFVTEIIRKKYPEYLSTWLNLNYIYIYNCYFTTKEIFEKYSKFLFDILDMFFKIFNIKNEFDARNHVMLSYELELINNMDQNIFENLDNFYRYQTNIGGFLQERLLTLFIAHNKLKPLYRQVIFTEKYKTFVNNKNEY